MTARNELLATSAAESKKEPKPENPIKKQLEEILANEKEFLAFLTTNKHFPDISAERWMAFMQDEYEEKYTFLNGLLKGKTQDYPFKLGANTFWRLAYMTSAAEAYMHTYEYNGERMEPNETLHQKSRLFLLFLFANERRLFEKTLFTSSLKKTAQTSYNRFTPKYLLTIIGNKTAQFWLNLLPRQEILDALYLNTDKSYSPTMSEEDPFLVCYSPNSNSRNGDSSYEYDNYYTTGKMKHAIQCHQSVELILNLIKEKQSKYDAKLRSEEESKNEAYDIPTLKEAQSAAEEQKLQVVHECLELAVKYSHVALAECLVETFKLTIKNIKLETSPFIIAAQNYNIPMMKYLVSQKVNPSLPKKPDAENALLIAAFNNRLPMLQFLVEEAGVDPAKTLTCRSRHDDADDEDADKLHYEYGTAALAQAARRGHFNILKYLIEKGKMQAEPSKDNMEFLDPVTEAVGRKDFPMVKYLIEAKANVNRLIPGYMRIGTLLDCIEPDEEIYSFLKSNGALTFKEMCAAGEKEAENRDPEEGHDGRDTPSPKHRSNSDDDFDDLDDVAVELEDEDLVEDEVDQHIDFDMPTSIYQHRYTFYKDKQEEATQEILSKFGRFPAVKYYLMNKKHSDSYDAPIFILARLHELFQSGNATHPDYFLKHINENLVKKEDWLAMFKVEATLNDFENTWDGKDQYSDAVQLGNFKLAEWLLNNDYVEPIWACIAAVKDTTDINFISNVFKEAETALNKTEYMCSIIGDIAAKKNPDYNEVARYIVQHQFLEYCDFDVLSTDKKTLRRKNSMLLTVAEQGNLELLKILEKEFNAALKKDGLDINKVVKNSEPAMIDFLVSERKYKFIRRILISAVQAAFEENNFEMMKYLIEKYKFTPENHEMGYVTINMCRSLKNDLRCYLYLAQKFPDAISDNSHYEYEIEKKLAKFGYKKGDDYDPKRHETQKVTLLLEPPVIDLSEEKSEHKDVPSTPNVFR